MMNVSALVGDIKYHFKDVKKYNLTQHIRFINIFLD